MIIKESHLFGDWYECRYCANCKRRVDSFIDGGFPDWKRAEVCKFCGSSGKQRGWGFDTFTRTFRQDTRTWKLFGIPVWWKNTYVEKVPEEMTSPNFDPLKKQSA